MAARHVLVPEQWAETIEQDKENIPPNLLDILEFLPQRYKTRGKLLLTVLNNKINVDSDSAMLRNLNQ